MPKVLLVILKHLGCYLLGILACVLLTPVEFVLAGMPLWHLYPLLSVIFYFLYFTLDPADTFGPGGLHWLVIGLGLTPVVLGVAAHFSPLRRLRFLSPLLISFPIGFLGTFSVYLNAAASI